MADIFLSYAREDTLRARAVVAGLESRGWSVFWDRRIPTGHDFGEHLQQQIDAARCIVVLWSKASVASRFVRDEATEGFDGRLVPALIEAVNQPLGFRQLQAADLRDWHGVQPHLEFDRFVDAIATLVAVPVPPEKQPQELRGVPGYDFFTVDRDTGRAREFEQAFGPEAERDFWLALDDLARDISSVLAGLGCVNSPHG